MGPQRMPLHAVLASLCVALATVFAVTSAVGVVDHLQHEARIVHEHGPHLAFVSADDHHLAGHDEPRPDRDPHDGDEATDHASGAGHHHHADAPVGVLAGGGMVQRVGYLRDPTLSRPDDVDLKGVRPGGLERPPRASANLV